MAGKRLALIVATDQYDDPALRQLRASAEDAEALAGVLRDPEFGDFEVNTVRNEAHWAIGQRVEELLSSAKPEDLVVLYFSCHGIKDDSDELYLAAKNTRPNLLATTALEASLVNRLIQRSRSQRVLLLLDCCLGGAFEPGASARATEINVVDLFAQRDRGLGDARGRVVITASSAMEFAFEGSDLADGTSRWPPIFTRLLVEGLRSGQADRDGDGKFSLSEVFDYVFDRVREIAPNRTPSKFEYGVQEDFVLARNPNWTVAPLPAMLRELATDPSAPTRLGSVADLRRLAAGSDLAIATGARRQLELMVNDDSRQVAAAASAAIASLDFATSGSSVDLSQVDRAVEPPSPLKVAVDENVQFTVYRPRTIQPTLWYPLVAFAHLSERRADAPDDPDPIQEVDRQARQTLGEQFAGFAQLTEDFLSSIPREGELTLIPTATGITFNPSSRSFVWTESVHREEFRLRADVGTAGTTVRGRLSVFSGVLLVADVGLSFRVVADAIPEAPIERGVDQLRHYRKIFASYSHKDVEIAQLFERYASLFGDRYLRDWVDLRAGQRWGEELKRLIREADIFQLLWSSNAMRSEYVRQEYEYALSLGRPEFVRPTYWEQPLPQDAVAGLPPNELRALHFQRFAVSSLGSSIEAERAGAPPARPPDMPTSEPPARAPMAVERPRQVPPTTPAEPRVAQPGDRICSNCGGPNDPTRNFCRFCGTSLVTAVTRTGDSYDAILPGGSGRSDSAPRRTMLLPMLLAIGLLLLFILGTVALFSQPAR
jgi:hypothetical protein